MVPIDNLKKGLKLFCIYPWEHNLPEEEKIWEVYDFYPTIGGTDYWVKLRQPIIGWAREPLRDRQGRRRFYRRKLTASCKEIYLKTFRFC